MQWYDKLFFIGIALCGIGGMSCIVGFSVMLIQTRGRG